jgi:hypothetical protein
MTETWRAVAGWPYEVSDLGKVRRIAGATLRATPIPGGYLTVKLCRDGERQTFAVHRLVATAFHGEPPSPKHHAAHRDGCKGNNAAANLRWATAAENEADKAVHGTKVQGVRVNTAKINADAAAEIRRSALAASVIAQRFGITAGHVRNIRRGQSWKGAR